MNSSARRVSQRLEFLCQPDAVAASYIRDSWGFGPGGGVIFDLSNKTVVRVFSAWLMHSRLLACKSGVM